MSYSTTAALETWPMPRHISGNELEELGNRYHSLREDLTTEDAIGLTQLYNRFHDQSDVDSRIQEMRELHRKIDLAVARAYGWVDIDLEHGFHDVPYLPANDRIRFTISGPTRLEVLRRLSELNHQRYEEEVAQGLHVSGGVRTPRRATHNESIQPSFDFEQQPVGTKHGATAAMVILDFLCAHPDWHAKADVLAATKITDGQWNTAIADLIAGSKVERHGERRGARYRATDPEGTAP